MEQTRLLVAIVLSFLVLVIWTFFFSPEPPLPGEVPEVSEKTVQDETTTEPGEDTVTASNDMAPLPESDILLPDRLPRMITVDTPFYRVKISEEGAIFKSVVLKDYKESVEEDSPLKELIPEKISTGVLQAQFLGNQVPGMQHAVFSSDTDAETIKVDNSPRNIMFSWRNPDGVIIEKTFRFSPETYVIGLNITVKNSSASSIEDPLAVSLTGIAPVNAARYGFEGPSALLNNQLEQIKIKELKEPHTYTGTLKWAAVETRYFMLAMIPVSTEASQMRLSLKSENLLVNQYVYPSKPIAPGITKQFDMDLFMGPKSLKILSGLNNELNKAIYFGWFDFIAKPCLWLMNKLHSFIPNYGLAIIILTILIKLVLWPLGNKGYESMNEMKKLQPVMADLREKYKNDKQKMNQEVMALYKTYKVNPVGGCLPMILQIPVFFALYRMLYEAIELRHAPFFGWINDLSAPDRLFRFGFEIPFMQPPYGIPVLTIIMGGTMFLQQKMSPPPPDPTQAKMMMFMPIIFTFIFINFSSGLVLYWLVNNVLSIAQQYHISKK